MAFISIIYHTLTPAASGFSGGVSAKDRRSNQHSLFAVGVAEAQAPAAAEGFGIAG